MERGKAKGSIFLSMVIFGTIGLVRRAIPYSSALVAFFRGAVATLILLLVHLIRKRHFDWNALKANLAKLLISGALIGFNWVLLFESYRFTSVSIATVCYYMAPVFIMISSVFTLHEKITAKKAICVVLAMLGVVLVSGILGTQNEQSQNNLIGVLLGLSAALLYACVVNINKRIENVDGMDRTIFQMGPAAIAVLPYWLLTDNIGAIQIEAIPLLWLLVAAVINTALAYDLYFGAIEHVPAQSAALMSYIDPAVAIILSAIVLGERLNAISIIGVILILGSAIAGEISFRKEKGEPKEFA